MVVKPGVYTTEFWSHLVFQVIMFAQDFGIGSFVPNRYAIMAQGIVAGLYAVSRGWAKSNPTAVVDSPGYTDSGLRAGK